MTTEKPADSLQNLLNKNRLNVKGKSIVERLVYSEQLNPKVGEI